VRKLEAFFGVLIATMAVSFAIMFGETKPSGKELLIGSYILSISILFTIVSFPTVNLRPCGITIDYSMMLSVQALWSQN